MESVNLQTNLDNISTQVPIVVNDIQSDKHLNVTLNLLSVMTINDESAVTDKLFQKWEDQELQQLCVEVQQTQDTSNENTIPSEVQQLDSVQPQHFQTEKITVVESVNVVTNEIKSEISEHVSKQEESSSISYCPNVVNTHPVYNFPQLMQQYSSFTEYYRVQREAELQRLAQESLYREQVLMSRFNHNFGVQVQMPFQNIVIPAGWECIASNPDAMEDLRRIFAKIREFIMMGFTVFPKEENIFKAFELCPLDNVNIVILSQDPYETRDKILGIEKACGMAFSGRKGGEIPVSLQRIFAEIKRTFPGIPLEHADLTSWAQQGVLLLNAALTVNEGNPDSHGKTGMYKFFLEFIVKTISERRPGTIWCLWGRKAEALEPYIGKKCYILKSGHPSGRNNSDFKFAENNHFAYIYYLLQQMNKQQVNWALV